MSNAQLSEELSNRKQHKKQKKPMKVPHVFDLLFIIVIGAVALTYLIPAGEFDRVEDPDTGRELVEQGSFHSVEQSPISLFEVPKLFVTGLNEAADIVLFIFVVGGAFQIITAT